MNDFEPDEGLDDFEEDDESAFDEESEDNSGSDEGSTDAGGGTEGRHIDNKKLIYLLVGLAVAMVVIMLVNRFLNFNDKKVKVDEQRKKIEAVRKANESTEVSEKAQKLQAAKEQIQKELDEQAADLDEREKALEEHEKALSAGSESGGGEQESSGGRHVDLSDGDESGDKDGGGSESTGGWTEFADKLDGFDREVEGTFSVTKVTSYASVAESSEIQLKTVAKGSISGLDGTYEIELPYEKGCQLLTGDKFSVKCRVKEVKGKLLVGSISY